MSLPRFELPEDDDATGPAQFVLKLPASYVQKLEALRPSAPPAPPPMTWPTPSTPWTLEAPKAAPAPAPFPAWTKLVALAAAIIVVAVGASAGAVGAAASGGGPVGIATHAPKSLEHQVHASIVRTGIAPHLRSTTVSIESLPRARHRKRHRR